MSTQTLHVFLPILMMPPNFLQLLVQFVSNRLCVLESDDEPNFAKSMFNDLF